MFRLPEFLVYIIIDGSPEEQLILSAVQAIELLSALPASVTT